MVTTDHGGPNHSKLNVTRAYAELQDSRRLVPEVLQFYGMELNMPAMDHHTLIIPHAEDEWLTLFDIERQFDANEAWPVDPSRDTEAAALAALAHMKTLPRLPLVFANHPSRSAKGIGIYGLDEPREFRNRNDAAPEVYRGLEGGPGHQAAALAPRRLAATRQDGAAHRRARRLQQRRRAHARRLRPDDRDRRRSVGRAARRRAALLDCRLLRLSTCTTPSPRARGSDFWPGQFHKTYVHARAELRRRARRSARGPAVCGGRRSDHRARRGGGRGRRSAETGGTLRVAAGEPFDSTSVSATRKRPTRTATARR